MILLRKYAAAAILTLAGAPLAWTQTPEAPSPVASDAAAPAFVLKVNSDMVLTNVVARDAKTGELVTGLKQSDFTVLENGKPQQIRSFDFENIEQAAVLNETTIGGRATADDKGNAIVVTRPEELHNRRLIVMFFDLTSMQPEDLDRCVDAALDFLRVKMQPADLVALVSLSETLKVDQDFTADRATLERKVAAYNGDEGQGFAPGSTSDSDQVEDASGFTPDESEFNDLNTDRQLFAVRAIALSLARINERKSMLYFSGGVSRNGIENQASLRAAINAAVRSNMVIYSVDTRGLEAISPLGDASTGSMRGGGAFNGGVLGNRMQANFASQEVMATLSSETGGKAFFDSNDFAPAFARLQRDSTAYYAIGFRSSNLARDGRFRKLVLKVNRPGVKLEYRPGYYAPADFQHSGKEDRERELQEQMASEMPATELALYLDAMYFRLRDGLFIMPVSLIAPGAQIPFVQGGDKDKATLDIFGEVLDAAKRRIGSARETVKLDLPASQQARRKNIQYTTSFNLPPGKYCIKFVVRENQSGRMGSFEAEIVLPELKKDALKISSIVLASQRQPSNSRSPLSREGVEYTPNISHVFRQDQSLYLLYELYDPGRVKPADGAAQSAKPAIDVLTSLEILQGQNKVFETPLTRARELNVTGFREALSVALEAPLDMLKPGQYVCQLNIIDDVLGRFAFPRFAILVKEPETNAGTAVR